MILLLASLISPIKLSKFSYKKAEIRLSSAYQIFMKTRALRVLAPSRRALHHRAPRAYKNALDALFNHQTIDKIETLKQAPQGTSK